MQKTGKKGLLPWIILIVSACIFVYACLQLVLYWHGSRREAGLEDELRKIRQDALAFEEGAQAASEASDGAQTETAALWDGDRAYERLKAMNSDYVAWLDIPGTPVSYPIVQRDNTYYLKRDFKQEKSSHGSIFLDEDCGEESPVWLLHGHHMKDGSMFGALKAYENRDYISEHQEIQLETEVDRAKYRIFAVALIDFTKEEETAVFHYEELPQDQAELTEYLQKLQKNAFWYDEETEKSLQEPDFDEDEPLFLVLSTCEYHTDLERLIIVAKRED